MSLRPSELRDVARALEPELAGAVVQKVRAPWPGRLELELRQPGRTVRLLLSVESGLGRLSVIEARTLSGQDSGPGPWLLRARKELTGRRLSAIRCTGPRQVRLVFEKGGTSRTLVAELDSPGASSCSAMARRRSRRPRDRRALRCPERRWTTAARPRDSGRRVG